MRKDIAFTIAGPVATKRHTSPKHRARRRGPKTTNAGEKSSRRRAKRARSVPQARASMSSAHVVHTRHCAEKSRARRLPLNGGPFSFLVRREGRTSMLPLNPAKQGSVVRTSPEIALGMPTDAGRKQFMAPIRQQAGNDLPPRHSEALNNAEAARPPGFPASRSRPRKRGPAEAATRQGRGRAGATCRASPCPAPSRGAQARRAAPRDDQCVLRTRGLAGASDCEATGW